jgi:AraC family transcriptional activator of pobA
VLASRHVVLNESAPRRSAVTHDHAALAFYTGGRSRMEQNGAYDLEPGDVLIVPAGAAHRRLESRRPEYWGLGLSVPSFAGDASLLEPFERVRDGASAVVRIDPARHAYLESLFRELSPEGAAPGHGDMLAAVQRSLLTLILAEVGRGMTAVPQAARSGVVAEALRFIERNCLRPLTLNEVASAVGRTPTHVTAALARATGKSAVEWIVSGRMAEARRLLLHSDERIDIIAERVGYADATHFIRMFRRAHGVTPAAWRAEALRSGRASPARR